MALPYVLCGAALQAGDVPSRGQRRDRRSGAVAELTEITELGNGGIRVQNVWIFHPMQLDGSLEKVEGVGIWGPQGWGEWHRRSRGPQG